METNETRKGKYSKIILKEKKIPKMKKPNKESKIRKNKTYKYWRKTLLEKEWGVYSFSKLQTCIQIKIYIKVKKKHFIFIIKNINKSKKHIKIKK